MLENKTQPIDLNLTTNMLEAQTPWAKEVSRLISIGFSLPQISVQTGISIGELTRLVKSPDFGQTLRDTSEELKQTTCELRLRLEMAAQSALDTIIDLMHSGRSEMVRRMCSLDIIDRAGYGTVQKHEVSQTLIIDDKRADLIIQASREIGKGELVVPNSSPK